MKVTLLDLGALSTDAALYVRGGNLGTVDAPTPKEHAWRVVQLIGAAIEHPTAGLLLYDTGMPPTEGDTLGPQFRVLHRERRHDLDAALTAAGYDLGNVAGVIISHLHFDHCGGLVHLRGTDVPVYVHEDELKHALFALATGEDASYTAETIDFTTNWQPLSGDVVDLFKGIELHRVGGHTPGLLTLRVTQNDGCSLLFASDHYSYPDNRTNRYQGWALRDDYAFQQACRRIEVLIGRHNLDVVYGHDPVTFRRISGQPATARDVTP